MRFKEFLAEVEIITTNYSKPLTDNMTIRVYHGAYSPETVVTALEHGLSGNVKANRRYSYEDNNNPRGLFVTPSLDVAKKFGDYIIEFHSRVKDLDSPVWPGGAYTVQGGESGVFNNDAEREEERKKHRSHHSKNDNPSIAQSDRPEVAAALLSYGEPQALFTGVLNKNSIRAIWVKDNINQYNSNFSRIPPKKFLETYNTSGIKTRYGTLFTSASKTKYSADASAKLFAPRDTPTVNELISKVQKHFKIDSRDYVIGILKENPDYISRFVWGETLAKKLHAELLNSY